MTRDTSGTTLRRASIALVAAALAITIAPTSAAASDTPVGTQDTSRGGAFVPIEPVRALDTRQTGGCVGASDRPLALAGANAIPADVRAVSLNVTVTQAERNGFLTVYPAGEARPGVSNLNFARGQTVPNAVTIGIGSGGQIMLHASPGSCPQVIVDVNGYYTGGETTIAGGFIPLPPTRIFDSRQGGGCVGIADRTVPLAGTLPVDASAVSLNVTVTQADRNGFLTVYPGGAQRPNASNLNFARGQTVPNAVTVGVGTNGQIRLHSSGNSCPQVIVDISGYFTDGDPDQGGFVPTTPTRILDTRRSDLGFGTVGGPANCGQLGELRLPTLAAADANGLDLPMTTQAVYLNVTVTGALANGFVSVAPAGGAAPPVSNLNFARNQTVPNAVNVGLGSGGDIVLRSSAGSCPQMIVDVVGYSQGLTDEITRFDLGTTQEPVALAGHGARLWAAVRPPAGADGIVVVDAVSGDRTPLLTLPPNAEVEAMTADGTDLWVAWSHGTTNELWQIDPDSGLVAEEIPLAGRASDVVSDGNHVWIGYVALARVDRIDIDDPGQMSPIVVAGQVAALELGGGALWAATTADVTRIDISTLTTTAIAIEFPVTLAWAGDRLWTATFDLEAGAARLLAVDPSDNVITDLGAAPFTTALTNAGGRLWAAMGLTQSPDLVELDPTTGARRGILHAAAFAPGAQAILASTGSSLWTVTRELDLDEGDWRYGLLRVAP